MACEATPKLLKMNLSSHLLVPEPPQMSVLNPVLWETIFTEGGHYSPVNNVLGGQYSLVNNVRGPAWGHYWGGGGGGGGHCTL